MKTQTTKKKKCITVSYEAWKTFQVYRLKFGYHTLEKFMDDVAKMIKQFKPEFKVAEK